MSDEAVSWTSSWTGPAVEIFRKKNEFPKCVCIPGLTKEWILLCHRAPLYLTVYYWYIIGPRWSTGGRNKFLRALEEEEAVAWWFVHRGPSVASPTWLDQHTPSHSSANSEKQQLDRLHQFVNKVPALCSPIEVLWSRYQLVQLTRRPATGESLWPWSEVQRPLSSSFFFLVLPMTLQKTNQCYWTCCFVVFVGALHSWTS